MGQVLGYEESIALQTPVLDRTPDHWRAMRLDPNSAAVRARIRLAQRNADLAAGRAAAVRARKRLSKPAKKWRAVLLRLEECDTAALRELEAAWRQPTSIILRKLIHAARSTIK